MAAKKSKIERFLTFNFHNFMRIWPEEEDIIYVL